MDQDFKSYLDGQFGDLRKEVDRLREDMDRRFDDVDRRLDRQFGDVDRRFDDVDRQFGDVDRRFDDVDRRFDDVDRRLGDVDRRFDDVDRRFGDVDREVAGLRDDVHQTRILVEKVNDKIDLVAEGVQSNTQVMHRLHEENRRELRESRSVTEAAIRHLESRTSAHDVALGKLDRRVGAVEVRRPPKALG